MWGKKKRSKFQGSGCPCARQMVVTANDILVTHRPAAGIERRCFRAKPAHATLLQNPASAAATLSF